MEGYCVNLSFSWNTLVSPFMVIESFAGYSSLGWQLCSLRVYIISVQDLLAFIVSGEKSGVILIGLPLYVCLSQGFYSCTNMTTKQLGRKGFIRCTLPHCCSSMKEVRTGTKH